MAKTKTAPENDNLPDFEIRTLRNLYLQRTGHPYPGNDATIRAYLASPASRQTKGRGDWYEVPLYLMASGK